MRLNFILILAIAAVLFVSGCSSKTEVSGGGGKLPTVEEPKQAELPETDPLNSEISGLDNLTQDAGNLDYLEEDLNSISNI